MEGESVHAFLVEIRRIAGNCNFGSMLDRMLRDRIVCGVRSSTLQTQLLAKRELTLEEAEALAVSAETAENDSKKMSSEPAAQVQARRHSSAQDNVKRDAPRECGRCGSTKHDDNSCGWVKSRCYRCGRHGHLAKKCRNAAARKSQVTKAAHATTLAVAEATSDVEGSDETHIWTFVSERKNFLEPPIRRTLTWGGVELPMEVDTGSPVCVISRQMFEKHRKVWPCLKPSRVKLSCYTGRIPVLGELQLRVCYKGVDVDCSLTVLDCSGPSLCGRDLLAKLKDAGMSILQWAGHDSAAPDPKCSSSVNIFSDYQDVFSRDLGVIKGPPASLQLKGGVSPKFCKARPIPYALRDKVSSELDRLVSLGVLSPVKHSEWATPIVPVHKKDGNVRICGDFKATLNPACAVEQYPLPVIEDIFARLNGGESFSTLDLRDAYNQVPLDEAARKLCVINTPSSHFVLPLFSHPLPPCRVLF